MRVDILGVKIHEITLEESTDAICEALEQGRSLRVVTANPEMIMGARRDAEMRSILEEADLVVPDGEGVVWAARFLGTGMRERVTGVDLTACLLERANTYGWRVFFVGGEPGVADEAAEAARVRFPGLEVRVHHGFFARGQEEERVLDCIREFRPHILLAGMGQPYQEYWLSRHGELAGVSMGVGGTFDVLSGRVKRAPQWSRRLRMEWLYRLVRDPRRLKRQLVLPLYMMRVVGQKMRGKRERSLS